MGLCTNYGRSLLFLFTIFSLPLISLSTTKHIWRRNLSTTTSPPPPVAVAPLKHRVYPFRPSIGVIVGVLTIIFFVTFLLLLYAKHCKRGNTYDYTSFSINGSRRFPPLADRKDSGVERAVVESLPVFRFESLRGQKDGLECAVCLNKFEANDLLRLLPKCKHGFHVECVDTWLNAHSTCPLCRHRISSGDFSLVDEYRCLQQDEIPVAQVENSSDDMVLGGVSRVSGRHSFDGSSGSLEVIMETARTNSTQPFMGRRSLDSWIFRKKTTSETVVVDCFERPRKDGLLLEDTTSSTGPAMEQRHLDHQIIVSKEIEGEDHDEEQPNHRWSDVQQSDLLLLCSEMILNDNVGSMQPELKSDRDVIKGRSLSAITGFSRFMIDDQEHENQRRRRAAGALSRWFAWISPAQTYQNQQRRKPPSASVIACKLHRTSKYTRSNSSLA